MSNDSQKVGEMMRDGAYFHQARQWYQAVYVGIISERAFFLLISALAILVALLGIASAVAFFPLADKPGIVVGNRKADDTRMLAVGLRKKNEPIDSALMRFFVNEYVLRREGYAAERYVSNYMFVRAHSDTLTFTPFAEGYTSSNPESPAARFGTAGVRQVAISRMDINEASEPQEAVVHFSREELFNGTATKTQWKAKVKFYYTKVAITPVVDRDTGVHSTEIEDPQFQVVSYELSPAQ